MRPLWRRTLLFVIPLAMLGCHPGRGSGIDASAPTDSAALSDARFDASVPTPVPHAAAAEDAGTDAHDAAPSHRVTISAGGDLTISPRLVQIALDHRPQGRLMWLLNRVAILFSPRDIAYADLETPLATQYHTPGTGHLEFLGAPTEFARDLARLGFDVISVATNHAYDQTAAGLEQTLHALRSAGIGVVGAGETDAHAYEPWRVERDGVRVAVFGFTVRTNDGPGDNPHQIRVARLDEPQRALAAIREVRPDVDLVVVGVHWSRDFEVAISESQRVLARQLVDAGADLVIGSGPHLLQRVDRITSPRGDAVVAYSLGNLLSNQGFRFNPERPRTGPTALPLDDPRTRDGAMLRVSFDASQPGHLSVIGLSATALWTQNGETEVRELPLRATEDDVRSQRLPQITAALGNAVRVRP